MTFDSLITQLRGRLAQLKESQPQNDAEAKNRLQNIRELQQAIVGAMGSLGHGREAETIATNALGEVLGEVALSNWRDGRTAESIADLETRLTEIAADVAERITMPGLFTPKG